jgi:hexosaminidase
MNANHHSRFRALARLVRATAALIVLATLWSPGPATAAAEPVMVPYPASVTAQPGGFALSRRTRIYAPTGDREARAVAVQLRDLLVRAGRPRLRIVETSGAAPAGGIVLRRGPAAGPEDYQVTVTSRAAEIVAADRRGLFYGAVTLWQLASQGNGAPMLPAVAIRDTPRFAWRGLMVDSARHFQTVAELKRLIDAMAIYKLNVLHWHLNDDQGWRLQIRAYPRLTEVGAWRTPKGADAPRPARGTARPYGGFYTQAQVRDLVAYAEARNITIVPEIELPGHATAALTAYPARGVTGAPPVSGMSDWGVYTNLYNVDDETFAFLDRILDEVMDLFPSRYIHAGGDEALKDQWRASPAVQARMRALGLRDEEALQAWFMARVASHLAARGRRLVGWDETLDGGTPADSVVMSWRGVAGARTAMLLGRDAVLSPQPDLYLDSRQSRSGREPPGRSELATLKTFYGFEPGFGDLPPEVQKRLLGVQANAWTEHMRTARRLETMAFPRLLALAELGWTPAAQRDWGRFSDGLQVPLAQLRRLGLAYDTVPFEPDVALSPSAHGLSAALASPLGLGRIRYTRDGRTPTLRSPEYAGPLDLSLGAKLRARTFLDGRPLGATRDFVVTTAAMQTRSSAELKPCGDSVPLRLEADAPARGPRPVFMISIYKPCWVWPAADLSRGLAIDARVGRVPFNFQLAGGRRVVRFDPPSTSPYGELVVRHRQGETATCEGETLAVIPLSQAVHDRAGLSSVGGRIPPTPGAHDLCFTFNRPTQETLWALDTVRLSP